MTINKWGVFGIFAAIGAGITALFFRNFERMPARNIPDNNLLFVSPANGKVLNIIPYDYTSAPVDEQYVNQIKDGGLIKVFTNDVSATGTIITITMNLDDVHYQRAPVDCTAVSSKYSPGTTKNALTAMRPENEHNEMLFTANTYGYNFKVIQIAGFAANKIEDYTKPGQALKQGDVIGLINLGSQVMVIIPNILTVACKVGDVVVDGETVLAKVFS